MKSFEETLNNFIAHRNIYGEYEDTLSIWIKIRLLWRKIELQDYQFSLAFMLYFWMFFAQIFNILYLIHELLQETKGFRNLLHSRSWRNIATKLFPSWFNVLTVHIDQLSVWILELESRRLEDSEWSTLSFSTLDNSKAACALWLNHSIAILIEELAVQGH